MITALKRIATALERLVDLKELELTQTISSVQSESDLDRGMSRLSLQRELRDG